MNLFKFSVLLILNVLIFSSCKKKELKENDCFSFSDLPEINYFVRYRFQMMTPSYNPNNNDEFVFYFEDYQLEKYSLIKYNMKTNLKTVLLENTMVIGKPQWSKNGWIAFSSLSSTGIYLSIIKENGDSLQQISNEGRTLYFDWTENQSDLYWFQDDGSSFSSYSYLFKRAVYENQKDTVFVGESIRCKFNHFEISPSNKLIAKTEIDNQTNYIGLFDLNANQLDYLMSLSSNQNGGLSSFSWQNNQTVFFSIINEGLFKMNVVNKTTEKIMSYSNCKRYLSISCSSDGKHLIGERIDLTPKKDSNGNYASAIRKQSSVYIIDLQTMNETKINLE